VQDTIARTILLENPASYLAFRGSTMTETDCIRAIVGRPLEHVGEIQLAGHAEQTDGFPRALRRFDHTAKRVR
jgi:uncharacterized protein